MAQCQTITDIRMMGGMTLAQTTTVPIEVIINPVIESSTDPWQIIISLGTLVAALIAVLASVWIGRAQIQQGFTIGEAVVGSIRKHRIQQEQTSQWRRTRRIWDTNWVTVSLGSYCVIEQGRVQRTALLPGQYANSVNDSPHSIPNPVRRLRAGKALTPVREHRVMHTFVIKSETTGDFSTDVTPQRLGGLPIRQALQLLEDHCRRNHPSRYRRAAPR
jgi:hypothetical protein